MVDYFSAAVVLAIIPVLLGIGVLRIGLGTWKDPGRDSRLKLFLVGLLALSACAGLTVGRAVRVVGSIVPAAAKKRAGI